MAPIFVLGTQRSGTTLLCRMLSAHPEIFIQNELNVRKMFLPGFKRDDILGITKELIREEHGKTLQTLLQESNKTIWGLKDPELTSYIKELECFLPESKFIVIVRDGRAVTNSYIENKWGLGTNAYTGAIRWEKEVRLQLDFLRRYPDNVYLLRYEDLVAQQEKELINLFRFLELPFHEDAVNYFNKPTYYHKTRENLKTYGQPDVKLTKKWEAKLSCRQKRVIEAVCGPLLDSLGYQLNESRYTVGSIEKTYYHFHQKIIGEIQIQYRWRLSTVREYFRKKSL